ncbi:Pex24p-domain-containing protein [Venturia nashicola]|nr:Pex24p-domain-containing protein [Venturia nashicola]
MAALDLPWLEHMSTPSKFPQDVSQGPTGESSSDAPTVAAFSPATLNHSPSALKQRSTILVHQKSPLLVATPPQITRALAYSHPFIAPLNKFVGLLSWTHTDPWESFLMLASFWAITLYGDVILRLAGPLVFVAFLILGMWSRRYSPLSSNATTGEKGSKGHKRGESELVRQHKSLDEIVDVLKVFTSRCNILLDPFLTMTDFLSTQRTATSATTRPALTLLFIRLLLVMPVWWLLTLPPFYIITTRRIILFVGTVVLTWHSRPARVTRTILWRSKLARKCTAIITGLDVAVPAENDGRPPLPPRRPRTAHEIAASLARKRQPESPGIRFTFTLYENQRRWLGIGWTSSMLAYERASWTDEHLNPASTRDRFELPEVEGGLARWRWVDGGAWHVEGTGKSLDGKHTEPEDGGWIYYDNKWHDGRRGKDGWGRYTRRRKWCRDAELVEVTPSTETTPSPTPALVHSDEHDTLAESTATIVGSGAASSSTTAMDDEVDGSVAGSKNRKQWFRRRSNTASQSAAGSGSVSSSLKSYPDEDDVYRPSLSSSSRGDSWGLGEDASMQMG